MSVREPSLTEREIRILRGMIDEYEYDEMRGRFLRNTWTTGKTLAVTVGIVLTMLSQIVTMIAVLRGGR